MCISQVADLTNEIASLRAKVAAGEDAASKLSQKQDVVTQLRKQLRAKDETIRTWQQRVRTRYQVWRDPGPDPDRHLKPRL